MGFRGRPIGLWLLLAVLGQLSVRALIGGTALVAVPSGALVGLPTAPLAGTPFGDFLVPGVVLLLAFGISPAVVCYGLCARRRWGWLASLGVAVALTIWVLVEVAIGFVRPTIYLNLGTAGTTVALALLPSVRDDVPASLDHRSK